LVASIVAQTAMSVRVDISVLIGFQQLQCSVITEPSAKR
jgi:hypothetical protein